ncbi:MAG: DUF6051 family protein [Bacteroidales bacterium]|jgi:hypothetical protein|nr:DUF6051 family protein [Bacteroidales bacterium]HHV41008.1 hypothetical protein [Bacteroidales bacterium]
MKRTKELYGRFSYEKPFLVPDRPIEVFPFHFTSVMGQQEVARVRESMKTAPFYPAADSTVAENQAFSYVVFVPSGRETYNRAIILLHGLNERSWNKYLVWAEDLVTTCGVPVLLFPMAFHMNRTPASWFSPRWLKPWLSRRKQEILGLCNASFFNIALSSRLSVEPLRFYSSGLESSYNLYQLMGDMKHGRHPLFTEGVKVDFFAYSIGALLAQVVLMADPCGYAADSALFTFCGGSVFERMNGNARDIIDQEAYEKIRDYYLGNFSQPSRMFAAQDQQMGLQFTEAFCKMIPSLDAGSKRQPFFTAARDRVRMVSLRKDTVIPTAGVQEAVGNDLVGIITEELDFPYAYTHQTPFPENEKVSEEEVVLAFRSVFDRAAAFLTT